MVYFVCEWCNETLKKAQVDRHLYSCKNCWGVTCVDCNFTFEGDSFREHTSCVSEDQKYQGALFKAPKAKQKNRGVNEIWADAIVLAASNASSGVAPKPLCAHLVRMGDLGNVPRQEKKFKNFVKNSLRVFDEGSVSKLWDYMDCVKNDMTREEKEAAVAAEAEAKAAARKQQEAEATSAGDKSKKAKKSKKRAREEADKSGVQDKEEGAEANGSGSGSGGEKRPRGQSAGEQGGGEEGAGGGGAVDAATRKALAKAAIGIVKKAPNKQIAVKELVKQAAAAVLVAMGEGTSSPDDQQLRRALKQRLKNEGLRRVTVEDKVAVYSKVAAGRIPAAG
eukprot:g2204.t1